ncbi:MAG: DUF1315 family protein [Gammaproteobacteria bacterium]|nr:DUF1315 family protein [Gammaproteobacteria bacterium]
MTYDELIRSMTPEVYARLREAVALGRWVDGRALSPEQRESSMQAIMAYETFCLDTEDEPFRMSPEGEFRIASKPKTPRDERIHVHALDS